MLWVPWLPGLLLGIPPSWVTACCLRGTLVSTKSQGCRYTAAQMEINLHAPAVADGETQITADPETVWEVIAAIEEWPTWNPDIKSASLEGPLGPGSVFRWKSGWSSLISTLQVVDRPREIAWTGKTMGIRAIHIFRLSPRDSGTLARSEESWEGLIATLLKGYSRKTLDRGIRAFLSALKNESERRASS